MGGMSPPFSIASIQTVAFQGMEARLVEVQCAVNPGLPAFNIVGLPDKAVSEAKERVRSALTSMSLALPAKRITVNLSPADLPKEGSHFDLPIALALLTAMGILPPEDMAAQVAMGELSLDGKIKPVIGALPAALSAGEAGLGFICPTSSGQEAAWVGSVQVIAPPDLISAMNHFTGRAALAPAEPGQLPPRQNSKCFSEVKGQEKAKRAMEIAAAGRHHSFLVGEPGSGKSMIAARLPGILPEMDATEALETSMIHSLAGLLSEGGIERSRPFRTPHHTASMAAIVGGGRGAKPGEVSLAHHGVLFLDELPEFPRAVLETLRQPIETGDVIVARANAHARYPCRFMLIAAANPCRCGYMPDPARACSRAPICGQDYLGKISGPLMDRFDIRVEVPPVSVADLAKAPGGDSTKVIAARVQAARSIQKVRYEGHPGIRVNADVEGDLLTEVCETSSEGQELLKMAAERYQLSARGYHRVLRLARTIADLGASARIERPHITEALSYRLSSESPPNLRAARAPSALADRRHGFTAHPNPASPAPVEPG